MILLKGVRVGEHDLKQPQVFLQLLKKIVFVEEKKVQKNANDKDEACQ